VKNNKTVLEKMDDSIRWSFLMGTFSITNISLCWSAVYVFIQTINSVTMVVLWCVYL